MIVGRGGRRPCAGRRGLRQDGMEGRHERGLERPHEGQDVAAVVTAEDPELVLERDDRGVVVEHPGRLAIGRGVAGVDDDADLGRIGQVAVVHMERRDVGRDARRVRPRGCRRRQPGACRSSRSRVNVAMPQWRGTYVDTKPACSGPVTGGGSREGRRPGRDQAAVVVPPHHHLPAAATPARRPPRARDLSAAAAIVGRIHRSRPEGGTAPLRRTRRRRWAPEKWGVQDPARSPRSR